MLKKITIDKIFINDKNKDGVSYVGKNGKYAGQPFVMVKIKTTDGQTVSTPSLLGGAPTQLTAGQTIVLNITESGDFKNFNIPSKKEIEVFNQFNQ